MQAALEAALGYGGDRRVFGRPVADFPLTLAKYARMAAWLHVCRHFTYAVARLMDDDQGQMEASLVKLLACRAAEWVCRDAQQVHGGMGYAEETAVSRYFVDARVLSIFEGAEETLAIRVIGKALVDQAAESRSARAG
jgi:(2S)-methylsuccinyl-CoA dehydrogenase